MLTVIVMMVCVHVVLGRGGHVTGDRLAMLMVVDTRRVLAVVVRGRFPRQQR